MAKRKLNRCPLCGAKATMCSPSGKGQPWNIDTTYCACGLVMYGRFGETQGVVAARWNRLTTWYPRYDEGASDGEKNS